MSEPVQIKVSDDVCLEAEYSFKHEECKAGALILHPHPLFGGNMHNNVVQALREAGMAEGLATLRFNFRGVGGSTGSFGGGVGEVEDVAAAANWLNKRINRPLILMGYSFGSLVGAQAAEEINSLAGGVWVAPPLSLGPLMPWPETAGDLLILVGENDEYTDIESLGHFISAMGARGSIRTFPGVNHFWNGRESALYSEVRAFIHAMGIS